MIAYTSFVVEIHSLGNSLIMYKCNEHFKFADHTLKNTDDLQNWVIFKSINVSGIYNEELIERERVCRKNKVLRKCTKATLTL
jgi:hypothetical protein